MLTIIVYIILLLSAVGTIIGWHNQKKGLLWGQYLAVTCALLGICLGFFQVYATAIGGLNQSVAASLRNREYERVKGIILGQYVRTNFPGKRILIIKDPTTQDDDALIAFRKETYNHIQVVGLLAPKPTPIENAPSGPGMEQYAPTDVWYTRKTLEALLANQSFDVLVSCLGLPEEVVVFGKDFNTPCLHGKKVVFLAGSIHNYVRAFMSSRLAAAVIANPEAVYDAKSVPKNRQEAFDKRYLMVTPGNYREMMEQYNVFKR